VDLVWEGIRGAFRLLVELDPEVLRVTALTLAVSGSATLVATAVGVVLGSFLALASFPGRRLALALVNTGMGLPPVAVGLLVAVLLWRSGPLGALGLIYTPAAMVIAQAVIALPIVTGFTAAAIGSLPPRLRLQVLALGASRWQALWLLLAAVMAGFGAAISEVGASLMVGGNIQGETRVLTTAIVLETSRGNFDLAIALSLLLLALVFAVNLLLTTVQQRRLS